jgi:cell division protein FtsB
VLARELSAGDDEAARLFRQAITLTREAEQARVTLARLNGLPDAGAAQREQIAALTRELETLQATQAATQAKLADFPRFRALSTKALTLDDLRASLKPGEAYLKMSQVGGSVYAMLVTPERATAYRTAITPAALEATVTALRNSISVLEDGQQLTYPFDVARSRKLFSSLFEPVAAQLSQARHIIFEPAGAMLKLPPNLLVTDDASVARYASQARRMSSTSATLPGLARARHLHRRVSARVPRCARGAGVESAVPVSRPGRECTGPARGDAGGRRRGRPR